MSPRPWVGQRMSLGSCDDCAEVWVIETERGKRCRRHHQLDKARQAHPSSWTAEQLDRLLVEVLMFDLDEQLEALLDEAGS